MKNYKDFMSEEQLLNKMAAGLKKAVSQPKAISGPPTAPTPAGQVPKPPKLPAPVKQVDTRKTGQMNDVDKEVNNHTRRLDAPGNVPGATGPKLVGLATPAASTAMKGRA